MTRECPSRDDKGKGVAKPKRKRQPRYIIKVPITISSFHALTTPDVGPLHGAHPTMLSTPDPHLHPLPDHVVHPTADTTVQPTLDNVVQPTPNPTILPTRSAFIGTPLDPPSIPTSSSIPSVDIHTPSGDHHSAVDVIDLHIHDRPMIEPYGQGFLPSRVASQVITKSIKQQFLKPGPTWGAIPPEDKDPFWQ
ncbi:hypothetical protein LR48_Vigan08g084600 [Vigna angularis]|uniref:Uncharacterized protein n=1 Tax=Phaseolus angularis TaxID=3914 RepID=A0A0L9V5T1_PHAAN|nr:hypothetical protein LR48_Vigan08g084600 [Vigna angularis]